jgi:hypothetical protein
MRNAREIHARITATGLELDQLNQRIDHLARQVQDGEDGWLGALEDLAHAYHRRNEIRLQMRRLHWVMTPDFDLAL